MATKEKQVSYAVKYEPMDPGAGVVVYKAVDVVKGYYDLDEEKFYVEQTGEVLNMANMVMPRLGKDEDHLYTPLAGEEVTEELSLDPVFAFPIEEEELRKGYEQVSSDDASLEDFYEREANYYLLFSIYDENIQDNIFYLADKDGDHKTINVDISLDLVASLSDGEEFSTIILFGGEGVPAEAASFLGLQKIDPNPETKPKAQPKSKSTNTSKIDFDPDKLEDKINKEVMFQEHVSKALVTTVYKNFRYRNIPKIKSNMLILGYPGCGKSELARALGRHLGVPIAFFDASNASASGYVGNSVTQALKDLISLHGGNKEAAEKNGVVFIDEIDKLAETGGSGVSKGDVQSELFKMLDGDEITIPAEGSFDRPIRFNTENLTFIAAGAAIDLIEEKKREKNKPKMGFTTEQGKKQELDESEIEIKPEDLFKYGLKPELVRRFPVIRAVRQLNKEQLKQITKSSRISNLRLYRDALKEDNVKLVIRPGVYDKIAEYAVKEKAGASGIKRTVDNAFEDAIRKVRLLKGKAGVLTIYPETIDDNSKYTIHELDGNKLGRQVYPPEEKPKVKKLGTKKANKE